MCFNFQFKNVNVCRMLNVTYSFLLATEGVFSELNTTITRATERTKRFAITAASLSAVTLLREIAFVKVFRKRSTI